MITLQLKCRDADQLAMIKYVISEANKEGANLSNISAQIEEYMQLDASVDTLKLTKDTSKGKLVISVALESGLFIGKIYKIQPVNAVLRYRFVGVDGNKFESTNAPKLKRRIMREYANYVAPTYTKLQLKNNALEELL